MKINESGRAGESIDCLIAQEKKVIIMLDKHT